MRFFFCPPMCDRFLFLSFTETWVRTSSSPSQGKPSEEPWTSKTCKQPVLWIIVVEQYQQERWLRFHSVLNPPSYKPRTLHRLLCLKPLRPLWDTFASVLLRSTPPLPPLLVKSINRRLKVNEEQLKLQWNQPKRAQNNNAAPFPHFSPCNFGVSNLSSFSSFLFFSSGAIFYGPGREHCVRSGVCVPVRRVVNHPAHATMRTQSFK